MLELLSAAWNASGLGRRLLIAALVGGLLPGLVLAKGWVDSGGAAAPGLGVAIGFPVGGAIVAMLATFIGTVEEVARTRGRRGVALLAKLAILAVIAGVIAVPAYLAS